MSSALSPYRLTGIGAPMAVWALHLVAVYSLQGVACAEGWDRLRFAGVESLAWWLVALTAAALAALAWFGLRAWRGWHIARFGQSDAPPALASRRRFAAAVTGALSVMAAVAVCFTTIPVLLLPGCA
ncbi:hypothetical protein [Luteimonas terricola]|uniref:Uncharacterized protein n=1 Tax=Luteimonas terricola TaxID=645597 RepID=A0ABQ2EIQ8_9GAMM|nr:hypothetical protein [Luteimonas terricola]GGK13601.1 hypothetical protein GCM10011394_23620 [Luteimonas terricola]